MTNHLSGWQITRNKPLRVAVCTSFFFLFLNKTKKNKEKCLGIQNATVSAS
jgi:hypothetical protein